MRSNKLFLLLAVTILSIQLSAQSFPDFLVGTWKVEGKASYEHWDKIDDTFLKGFSYKMEGEQKSIKEELVINTKEKDIVYTATVFNQNKGASIDFSLNQIDEYTFQFENFNHDFPNKINYKKIAPDSIYVQVLGKDDKGFSYKLIKTKSTSAIPAWFLNDLAANVGIWTTDNSKYLSEQETFDAYQMEWTWGIGKTSIIGQLHALKNGKRMQTLWEYRQYWDSETNQAVLLQYGNAGIVGKGIIEPLPNGEMELMQSFSMPNNSSWESKHITKMEQQQLTTTSLVKKGNSWEEDRKFIWYKTATNNDFNIGTFSISLAVKDINESLKFYQSLGFKPLPNAGSVDQKWLILKNGNSKVGLFQDMFPSNALTFNPSDARTIYKDLETKGIKSVFSLGLDKTKGPCSFSIVDPDGNSILIDQH